MLCERIQLSSQGDWPEADGVGCHRGNPLTYFIVGSQHRWELDMVLSNICIIVNCLFLESQWSISKMQRCQSGRIVGPDQFLWLQHSDFCSSC